MAAYEKGVEKVAAEKGYEGAHGDTRREAEDDVEFQYSVPGMASSSFYCTNGMTDAQVNEKGSPAGNKLYKKALLNIHQPKMGSLCWLPNVYNIIKILL